MNPFDGPHGELCNDELSTQSEVGDVIEVFADETKIGEVCQVHINGHGTRWSARSPHYARYGDIPGRPTGWVGRWPTRELAEETLRRYRPAQVTVPHGREDDTVWKKALRKRQYFGPGSWS